MTQSNTDASANSNGNGTGIVKPQLSVEKNRQRDSKDPEYVVGVGASAGGLEALEELFENMPIRSNMAFVVIQHLSPDYKSMMPELLNRKTMIPIVVATDKIRLQANTIYLLPPAKEMIASNGHLYLTERETKEALTLPINTFFRSLAESYRDKSIAIVLSGSGSDGSRGGALVHDNGGFVIAQDPGTCKFDSMPKAIIDTNKVDVILAPIAMPDVLLKYSKRTNKIEEHIAVGGLDAEENQFSEIIILLNNRFDLDFSLYKPSTITRRLERRLIFQKVKTLREYMDVLLSNKDELDALYCDLLIGVTSFFRDKLAFQSLDASLGKLFKSFDKVDEIRLWVSACASGQEAYSLSILLHEALEREGLPEQSYKIFATDMHQTSIETASLGRYGAADLVGLSEQQKLKYFTEVSPDVFQVIPLIRRSIVFAQHNLLKDAPFTNMHIVTCRNLLIYFNQASQQRVLSLLTFALRSQGILFLGPSESLGKYENDFKVIDQTHKLYRKTREVQHNVDVSQMPKLRAISNRSSATGGMSSRHEPKLSSKSKKALELLLQKYVPASVLIDAEGNILHVFGDMGKYFTMDFGAATLNIRSMVSGQAKFTITQMIARIVKTGKTIESRKVIGFTHFDAVKINMHTLSEGSNDSEYLIVSFSPEEPDVGVVIKDASDVPLITNELGASEIGTLDPHWRERLKELEEELEYSQESLQTTVEELESSNEELQATNEELMAANEEMQSTNEELQSVNEELYTVNAEFIEKESERNELAADERSIIEASGIGIVFLDKQLDIRKFSESAARVFNLVGSDVGRSFKTMWGDLVTQLLPYISKVFLGAEVVEQEFVSASGSIYHVSITAYRLLSDVQSTEDGDNSSGIVITVLDVTKQRALQNNLSATEGRFSQIINTISDGYMEWQYGDDQAFFSEQWLRTMGYEEKPSLETLLGDHFLQFQQRIGSATRNEQKFEEVLHFYQFDGKVSWYICKGEYVTAKGGSAKFTGILIDFCQYKALELQQLHQADKLERSNQLLEQFAYIVAHDLKAPLRHIQSFLNFLQQAINDGDAQAIDREMVSLFSNATLLEGLIDDVITFSRVNSERKIIESIQLNQVIEAVLETLSPIIEEKGVTVNCQDLGVVPGDRALFTHLFQNLVSNACKYNDKEQPCIYITCITGPEDCIIEVKDNGIGFDESQSTKIFAPFKRLVTKDKYEGSGIGLSICKTVVEQHNGHITANSILGEGSTFTITLPR